MMNGATKEEVQEYYMSLVELYKNVLVTALTHDLKFAPASMVEEMIALQRSLKE